MYLLAGATVAGTAIMARETARDIKAKLGRLEQERRRLINSTSDNTFDQDVRRLRQIRVEEDDLLDRLAGRIDPTAS